MILPRVALYFSAKKKMIIPLQHIAFSMLIDISFVYKLLMYVHAKNYQRDSLNWYNRIENLLKFGYHILELAMYI